MKGYRGQSCAQAIREVMQPGEILTFSELYRRVQRQGTWRSRTIWQNLMFCVHNLPPARLHSPKSDPFLFVHTDGRYELYDPQRHPQVRE